MSNRWCWITAFCCGWLATAASAAELQVRVVDRAGTPMEDVVVAAQPQKPSSNLLPTAPKTAVMDQVDQQFVPHILAVQAGAAVTFPNSDNISHQVYSFSPAKRFQLSLYRGHAHPPLMFPQPGVVVLGCNIHDSMIGYVYVAPGPHFGKTDDNGRLGFKDLPAGTYELSIWHPRFNEPQAQIQKTVQFGGQTDIALEIRLTRELRPELHSIRKNNDY